ncbi:hypothetical protein E4T42_00731 [Aureobasidium subglaciale]|nr:hypothetical protein E4T38_01805 [Aureobasidium subglaciale]KAI5229251.1 hypothetical protein E4T40_01675 [Aureobasidium subglaciale]KAI5233003.1 hypothetical protein E4T41_01803 [Aureobasidium subglaciale]KAI5258071.1 hypothetical protein E4T42_00731 [Aureobasidium subglaciale]KAI5266339.1 hypothetical protein E4T46_01672 [Aureobasidium subglaciale]
MTTNPDLIFALESITSASLSASTTTVRTTEPSSVATAKPSVLRPRDPRHGCINGTRISTCRLCAGHVLRTKIPCQGCKGTGFVGAKCGACAVGAAVALRSLIKETAAESLAQDESRAKEIGKGKTATKEEYNEERRLREA